MTSSAEQTPLFRWNAVCVDCAPADFERVVQFYCDMLGMRVYNKEPRWAALEFPDERMDILVQAEDWYVPPEWP
ncbi:MAG: hypothetical protein WD826_12500, partial [Actinomycetota bacterium]